jgi:hypothetical protein
MYTFCYGARNIGTNSKKVIFGQKEYGIFHLADRAQTSVSNSTFEEHRGDVILHLISREVLNILRQ